MDAAEYLRQRARMCEAIRCADCPFFNGDAGDNCMSRESIDPEAAVDIVCRWATENPVEPRITLTAMEERFVRIYIEKGYLWAARDKGGELNLYIRAPKRGADLFTSTSPTVHGSRTVYGYMFPGVTWENSPVCLPKLLGE